MNIIRKILFLSLCCLLFGGSTLEVFAQDGDYNPPNPAEPAVINYCKINVNASYPEGAYVSGGGKYKVSNGGRVYISTSARNTEDYTYQFQYWTLNGVQYTTSQNFYYTVQKGEMNFEAHYLKKEVVYDPSNPAEPSGSTVKRKYYLFLNSNIDNSCSFNVESGIKREEGASVYLRVYPNAYYKFEGWKVNGSIISTSTSFYYTMPSAATTIEAVLSEIPYDPESPIDPPSTGSGDVDNTDGTRKLVTLTIGPSEGHDADRTRVVFNDEKSLGYESDCDASKFISDDATYQIYSMDESTVKYQINERPYDKGIVLLGIIVKTAGSVTISTSRLDCEDAILVDKVLHVEHQLATGGYTFTSAAGTFESRFELKIPGDVLLGDVNNDGTINILDVLATLSIMKGDIGSFNQTAADANEDGGVNILDVLKIMEIMKNQ